MFNFNHMDVTSPQPNSLKYRKITAVAPFKVIQGHRL